MNFQSVWPDSYGIGAIIIATFSAKIHFAAVANPVDIFEEICLIVMRLEKRALIST